MKRHFLNRFSKNPQISNFVEVQWEPNFSMRTDGQTEIVAFHNFVNPPKKSVHVLNYGPLDEEIIRIEGMASRILKVGTRRT